MSFPGVSTYINCQSQLQRLTLRSLTFTLEKKILVKSEHVSDYLGNVFEPLRGYSNIFAVFFAWSVFLSFFSLFSKIDKSLNNISGGTTLLGPG